MEHLHIFFPVLFTVANNSNMSPSHVALNVMELQILYPLSVVHKYIHVLFPVHFLKLFLEIFPLLQMISEY